MSGPHFVIGWNKYLVVNHFVWNDVSFAHPQEVDIVEVIG
jgi:hypothetical protein